MERLTQRTEYGLTCNSKNCPKHAKGECDDGDDCREILLERLAAYEDTGLTPEQISGLCSMSERAKMADLLRLEEYQNAERAGMLVRMPFVAMIEQSLQGGKMTPNKDQLFNGRYAVVYYKPEVWKSPLIDICGKAYRTEEAEERCAEIAGIFKVGD